MRKLLRSIAKYRMMREGIQKPNKKRDYPNKEKRCSYFSLHWREYAK